MKKTNYVVLFPIARSCGTYLATQQLWLNFWSHTLIGFPNSQAPQYISIRRNALQGWRLVFLSSSHEENILPETWFQTGVLALPALRSLNPNILLLYSRKRIMHGNRQLPDLRSLTGPSDTMLPQKEQSNGYPYHGMSLGCMSRLQPNPSLVA